MKKAWRVIIVVVIALAVLGAVCMGVGIMTGADWSHISSVFHLEEYCDWLLQTLEVLESY